MPRTPRLDYPGARHHVMNRTLRKEALFTTDWMCSLFMDAAGDLPHMFGVRIHGFALMPNHYHMLIESPLGNLSAAMQHFGTSLTQNVNRVRKLDGPVFRGRFKNRVVEDDAYWMHLLAYVHLNPVRAFLCKAPEDWMWSSHAKYLGQVTEPDWLTTGEYLEAFGSVSAIADYVRDVQIKRRRGPAGFDESRLWIPSTTHVEPPADEPVRIGLDEAIDEVANALDVDRAELMALPGKPGGNPSAWIAIWWARRRTGLTQAEVGEPWGLSRARVSQICKALMVRARKDLVVEGMISRVTRRNE